MAVDHMTWSPVSDCLVVLYLEGSIFKWNRIDEGIQEVAMIADKIYGSPEGKQFRNRRSAWLKARLILLH